MKQWQHPGLFVAAPCGPAPRSKCILQRAPACCFTGSKLPSPRPWNTASSAITATRACSSRRLKTERHSSSVSQWENSTGETRHPTRGWGDKISYKLGCCLPIYYLADTKRGICITKGSVTLDLQAALTPPL